MITVIKPAGSVIQEMSTKAGNFRFDIIYLNGDRKIAHVIHKERSVFGYPLRFGDSLPTNLDVKFMTADWWMQWYR